MRMAVTLLRKAGYSVTIAAAMAFSCSAPAAPLGLPDTPMFLSAGAQPNLIMAIDDSGSMDFEVLFPANDGAAWWRMNASGSCTTALYNDSFVGCISNSTGTSDIPTADRLNFNNAGESVVQVGGTNTDSWRKFVYLFPNGEDDSNTSARRRLSDNGGHYALPPLPAFAWARSPNHNAAYFNPSVDYRPWVSSGDYSFGNSTATAARFDPVFESNLTINLTLDRAGSGSVDPATACLSTGTGISDNHHFKVYRGMTIPAGTCMRRSDSNSWELIGSDGCDVAESDGCDTSLLDRWDNEMDTLDNGALVSIRYFPATFYLAAGAALPSNYGYRAEATITGTAPDGTALTGYVIKSGNFVDAAAYNRAIQNFANWFTYYRKRHQALRAGLGQSFNDIVGIRVDGFTINNRQNVTMGSVDDPATRTALYRKFYTEWVRSGGTPNRSAVANMIANFKRDDGNAPITAACQKNFGMLFTDGFSNSPADNDGIRGVYGNEDQGQGAPYSDNVTGTLADAVMSAYLNPLRSSFQQGRVSPDTGCPLPGMPYAGGPLDCNRNLHMNFYAITLGARGLQFNSDSLFDPYVTAPTWPTTFPPRHPSAVDDLWHATINGRGKLLNARSPQEISTQLKSVLASITERTSSAAAATINGGSITNNSFVYQPRFNPADWSGQLLSYGIDPTTGLPSTAAGRTRDAADRIPAPDRRNIFTRNSTGQAVAFTWANLQTDTTRIQELDPNSSATEAERMLNYLRGDATNEGTATGQYRPRPATKLGDIVNSAPLFVGAPPFRYRDSLESAPYSAFASNNSRRSAMTYVGANDGMLHAFYADGDNRGTEAFAYIPGAVFPKLRQLASRSYGHQFYVDGSPSMGDAYFARNGESSARWRTVVAGGLNKGGQGVYAIDVTDPTAVNAGSVLWEFTDANDPDLGFTYSQPTIVKLRDGKWYAAFGNGYNSRLADGRASTTGSAVLFLVNLGTGVARKLDTGEGYAQRGETGNVLDQAITYDNGLATPSLIDTNGDRVVEYAYAGDLYGNMWKFDLSSTNPDSWSVAFGGQPLFKARNDAGQLQPITVRPEVTRGPNGNGLMVLFGTGKYLEASDKLLPPAVARMDQSFYGIVDASNAPVTYAERRSSVLTKQEILKEQAEPRQKADGTRVDNEIRVTTDRALGANQGWYMDLVSPLQGYEGERQVTSAVVRDIRVIFTTLTPDSDPCGFGGTSWLMELDFRDGSRLEIPPFDLNIDGRFEDQDMATADLGDGNGAQPYPPGGIRKKVEGILPQPVIGNGTFGTEGRPVQYKYLPGSSGNMVVIIENPGDGGTGRQSWRQVR